MAGGQEKELSDDEVKSLVDRLLSDCGQRIERDEPGPDPVEPEERDAFAEQKKSPVEITPRSKGESLPAIGRPRTRKSRTP